MKFGGTSVANLSRIKKLQQLVKNKVLSGNKKIVVVVSAMSGVTNDLIKKSKGISKSFSDAEYDVLVSSGEQIACSLIAGRLIDKGYKSRSWLAWQIPILTEGLHKNSRINQINKNEIIRYLKIGGIPIVTGFQGINNRGDITTLGRGGSDTTAVALAAALKAQECQIYTDVDGVYTTDPRICSKAKRIDVLTYEEMLEMAGLGSRVLQLRSVEFASKYNVPLRVLHAHNSNNIGTLIKKEEKNMEGALISGIAFTKDESEIIIKGVKDQPGVASKILGPIGDANIEVDMIVQNVGSDGLADFTFTVSRNSLNKAVKVIEKHKKIMGYQNIESKRNIVKVVFLFIIYSGQVGGNESGMGMQFIR